MLNLRKNTLAAAVAAVAVVGGGLSVAQAQDAHVFAPYVAANNLGQALIYPYFTVRGGWRTFIHVTNTSDQTVANRVRFRAAKDSEDVLDFVLVLSPHDMWTAVVEERDGKPGVRATDNSCTAPNIGKGNFVPFRDLRVDSLDELREGYAYIIQMGVALDENQQVAKDAKHGSSGVPANCAGVTAAFSRTNIDATRTQFADNDSETVNVNVLAGKFDLVNPVEGQSGAARAVAIADFNLEAGNLIYGQFEGDWDYPNLASAYDTAPNKNEDTGPVNAALAADAISNEWVLNPGIDERSSWIVTFPTKLVAGYDENYCVEVAIDLYDREEKTTTEEVDFSPGGVAPNTLCNEVNVINFVSGSRNSTSLLNSAVAKEINVDVLAPSLVGWARLRPVEYTYIGDDDNGDGDDDNGDGDELDENKLYGVGFNLTARGADIDDAVLYDHNYEGRAQIPGLRE
jgi:hypothetical protein